ncbi:MAG: hypothetical protein Q8Q49_01405 [bacterium]|nr:hypothetical protein [bacterium]
MTQPDQEQSIGSGTEQPQELPFNGLLLSENQVWTGMTVALCLDGKDSVELDAEGEPMVMEALIGGVPARRKLYPIKGGIVSHAGGNVLTAIGLEGFRPDVRFMPVEVFSSEDAPAEREFAVFLSGEALKYDNSRNSVIVSTDKSRRVISTNGYEYPSWQRQYPLPEGALMVPIDRSRIPTSPAPSVRVSA